VYDNLGQYRKALDYYQQALEIQREIGDKGGVGNNLMNLGGVYDNLGQYRKALDYYQQALEIQREIGDKRGVSNNLTNLGVVYMNLGQYRKALDYSQQALEIQREIGDKRGVSNNLTNLGAVYHNLGQYQKALDYSQQALEIQREIGDKHGVSNNLSNFGTVYMNLGQYRKALDYSQQALAIHREIGDKRGEGADLSNLGAVYMNLGQYQKALDYLQQALAIHREIGDKRGEGGDLTKLGAVYKNLGQYQKALDYFQQALEIKREINDKRGIGNSLGNLGAIYDNLGKYRKALDYYQQALAIHREIGDKGGEGANLSNLGVMYNNLGQYRKALDYYQQALAIAREIGDKRGEGGDLNNIGMVYHSLGQYRKALDYYQQALAIFRKIGDKHGESADLANLGVVYDYFGQYRKALDYYQQALAIHREIGDKRGEGGDLNNIGMVYHSLGQYRKALDYYQQALAIFRKIGDKRGESTDLTNLGGVYHSLGQYRKALDYYQQALEIQRQIGDKRGVGNNLTNLGIVYKNLGQYQKAKTHFKDSITLIKNLDIKNWKAFGGLASTEVKLNQFDAAITHYEQAIDNIEKIRAEVSEKEHKLSFMRDKLHVYDEFITLLKNLHEKHPDKGYDRKAIEIFERKQSRVFLEEMGKSGARRFAGVPEDISQRDKELEQQIAATRKHRNEARAKGKDAEPHRKRLEKLQAEQADLEKTLQTDYPAYYALKYPKPVALENLQKNVLQAGELMLVYNVREESTDLWVIGQEHFVGFTIPLTEAQIQQQVTAFRDTGIETMLNEIDTAKKRKLEGIALKIHLENAISDTLPDFVETSHALYQQLLPEPVRERFKKAHTLYIIPTGALYSLPFEALVTVPDEEEPDYLIQDYAIAYLSSASLLKILRDAEKRSDTEERQALLAFADPVFQQEKCEKGDDRTVRGLRTRAYRDLLGACLPQLPATKDEALKIAKLFNVTPHSYPQALYLGEDASRENVLQLNEDEELDDFRYVLFATHAVLPDELSYINQPAVLLSYPEKGGYLTMADVFGLQMNADLVTLSACNTGRGENTKGEGVRGLTRAFMYAGTPAVSVSLWTVNSQATQQLNQIFFTQLKEKRQYADALRQAKMAMIEGEVEDIYSHPYFWAGFVVFGDGE
jgi:tetratricopeptide (TPR) repeat protein